MPCADQGHGDQTSRHRCLSRPWRRPDGVHLRQPPPQHGRRPARFAGQAVDALPLGDAHVREGALELLVAYEFNGDIRVPIHGITRTYHNAVASLVHVTDLAFGLLATYDWDERRRRRGQKPQGVRRLEDDGSIIGAGRQVILTQQARDERDSLLSGVGRDGERAVRGVDQPLAEGAPVTGKGRREDRSCHPRLAGRSPVIPAFLDRLEASPGHPQLAGQPDSWRDRCLQPLLQIACIVRPHGLPVPGRVLASGPLILGRPIAGGDEHEGAIRSLGWREHVQTGLVVTLSLVSWALADAELPTRAARLHPRRRCLCFDPAVPTVTLSVVESGEVHATQLASRRVDETSQQNREMVARVDVRRRPILDLLGCDGEEVRHVGADRHGAIVVAAAIAFGSCLEIEEPLPLRAERLLQP